MYYIVDWSYSFDLLCQVLFGQFLIENIIDLNISSSLEYVLILFPYSESGLWRGHINGKHGYFKFIHVEIISEFPPSQNGKLT